MKQIARGFLLRVKVSASKAGQVPLDFYGIVFALNLHGRELAKDPELHAFIRPSWFQALLRHGGSDEAPLASILTALTIAAPGVAGESFELEFRLNWEADKPIFGFLLNAAWSRESENALAEVLKASPLQPTSYETGLALLAQHNPSLAREVAGQRLEEHVSQPDNAARRVTIAVCLFRFNDLWEKAWPRFAEDPTSARQILLEHGDWLRSSRDGKDLAQMPKRFAAALYNLTLETSPPRNYPRGTGPRELGPVDMVYDLQRDLQSILEKAGSHRELKEIYDHHASKGGWWNTGPSVERALTQAHTLSRIPPDAAQFVHFLTTRGGVFISDNRSLQKAVLASLRRYDKQLRPNGINALWTSDSFRIPREEDALQVEIARHLETEFKELGMVVSMEPRTKGKERVDIRVGNGEWSVIIEVKTGHSADRDRPLRRSMRIQLRDTYLKDSGTTHGIYVVGWFLSGIHTAASRYEVARSRAQVLRCPSQEIIHRRLCTCRIVLDCRWRESITARARRRNAAPRAAKR